MRLIGVSFALALVACDVPPQQRAQDVCTAFCDCSETTTPQVNACITDCVPDIGTVTDDCLTCVYARSQTCGPLFDDCLSMCITQPTD